MSEPISIGQALRPVIARPREQNRRRRLSEPLQSEHKPGSDSDIAIRPPEIVPRRCAEKGKTTMSVRSRLGKIETALGQNQPQPAERIFAIIFPGDDVPSDLTKWQTYQRGDGRLPGNPHLCLLQSAHEVEVRKGG